MVKHLTHKTRVGSYYVGAQPLFFIVPNANGSKLSVVHKLIKGMAIADFERAYNQTFTDFYTTKEEAKNSINNKVTEMTTEYEEEYRRATCPVPVRNRSGIAKMIHPEI